MRHWPPSATHDTLRLRASLATAARQHFLSTDCLEVSTPCLQGAANRDRGIAPMQVNAAGAARWLVTSPEHFLKRLLATGLGDCYSMGPVFRGGNTSDTTELSRRHNPEFTMLEWYRIGWSLEQIVGECCHLFDQWCGSRPLVWRRYRDCFRATLDLDPLTSSDAAIAQHLNGDEQLACDSRQDMLDLLLATRVEPTFDPAVWTVVSHFPADQAAQARVICEEEDLPSERSTMVAARAEIHGAGMELANAYDECSNAAELAQRWRASDQDHASGLEDQALLAALEHGLPACAGIAVGFDRVVMMAAGKTDICEVLPFTWNRV